MKPSELSLAGLESAWNPGLRIAAGRGAPARLAAASFGAEAPPVSGQDAEVGVPVLIAKCPGQTSAIFDEAELRSTRQFGRVYRLKSVELASLLDLKSCCCGSAPRLLLADAALIAPASVEALRDLQRRMPATDWLIGWDAPTQQGLGAAIRSQVRGCVDWSACEVQLANALDAVQAGGLWFPPPVLQALYMALLDSATAVVPPTSCAAHLSVRLTAREDEVLSLMRRGMTNKQIAERLDISVNTVKKHLAHVFDKHGLHGRRQQIA